MKRAKRRADSRAAAPVAELDGQLVGELTLFTEQRLRTRHSLSFGISVDPAFAGRGIGEQLIRTGLDYAFNWMGIIRVELEATA
ncbi:hypothetical protein CRX72_27765 [Pantoea sp. BRM17]|nr:hypothetical protein CRX72_27765 [Pantoea sp. BRM17]